MKSSRLLFGIIVLLLVFYLCLTIYEEPVHDVLYGKYIGGYVAVTAIHSGNLTVVTNYGGPDLDKAISLTVLSDNQTYNLGLKPGSTISIPYHNGSIIAIATVDQGGIFNSHKIHEFPVLDTTI
jgi:hypothetical protein